MTTWRFEAELYPWGEGPGSWVFLSLPPHVTDEIDDALVGPRRGFGSVRVSVTIGGTTWRTSIFPSKEARTYVLPVKQQVRRAEEVDAGDTVTVDLTVLD